MLMSEIEIITDGGRRCRWSATDKLRIVEETCARRNGVVARRRNPGGVDPAGAGSNAKLHFEPNSVYSRIAPTIG